MDTDDGGNLSSWLLWNQWFEKLYRNSGFNLALPGIKGVSRGTCGLRLQHYWGKYDLSIDWLKAVNNICVKNPSYMFSTLEVVLGISKLNIATMTAFDLLTSAST